MKYFTSLLVVLTTTVIMAQQVQKPSVDVTGEGIVSIIPDQVTIKARVENTGKDAKTVKQQNDVIVNEVFSMLRKLAVKEKYIQTAYVRLSKNYEYTTKTFNYAANQSISIKLTDLSSYEKVMNGLLNSGINRIDGVRFSSSQQRDLEQEARKKAVMNAKIKAIDYAGVLEQKIGKAIRISEFQQSSSPQPMLRSMAIMESDAASSQQTIAPGEMEIKVRITISFELL